MARMSAMLPATTPTPRPAARGVVYTPLPLVRFVINRAVSAHGGQGSRWLDPACGDGRFLAEAVQRIAGWVGREALPRRVETSLFGFDVDARACDEARAGVRAAVEAISGPQADDFFVHNVHCADFLTTDAAEWNAFDLIVGNPPYVSAEHLDAETKAALSARFATAWGRLDLYGVFFEQALTFLSPAGCLSFITPDKFLASKSARPLRRLIASRFSVRSVDRFDRHDLFPGVATVPAVTVIERPLAKDRAPVAPLATWWDVDDAGVPARRSPGTTLQTAVDGRPWVCAPPAAKARLTVPLGELTSRISAGLATGLNDCFVVDAATAAGLESRLLRPAVRGRDVQPQTVLDSGLQLIFPYREGPGGATQLVKLDDVPRIAQHLARHRERLGQRHCVRVWKKAWYDLHDPVVCDLAQVPKILLPDLARSSRFAFDPGTVVPLHSAYYMLVKATSPLSATALVALLNSPALERVLLERAPIAKSGYRRLRAQFLRDLPIPVLNTHEQCVLTSDRDAMAERARWALRHVA